MVTRRDVARLAGTSPAVVSYVLNDGPRGVAPATRERVLHAVDQLGYRPNRIASSLRTNRTMTLGLVVPDNTNPYFAELARAIEDVAFAEGYTLLLGNATDRAERENAYIQAFLDRRVDGILLIPSHDSVAAAAELARTGTPWVLMDRLLDLDGVPAVVLSDNRQGGRLATEHLIGHGRRRIACISGPRDVRNTSERVMGWRDALAATPLDPDAAPLREVPFDRFAGYRAARDILTRHDEIDAIFVASDEQALGVMRALGELGRTCPRDIALVSFDGVAASLLTTPTLSTIRQPVAALARHAVARILTQREEEPAPVETIVLPVELVARGSCGCPDVSDGVDYLDTEHEPA
ncbi:LacI family DNA-binding transcriptional regulator [Jiangella asiatica]|uniref:LacI family transcriptional regulator n=1 Tax=Jiangella asiatica TaxID=2530372 RepID=A0A4R5DLJ3_9ACTN|nr:LacI family DNA-binding transcriptional regulator [Jiangella asiatica]TDE15106.1 LacI family transcriptional regulator [Jiangella asiatica]